jgi:hypothetical protein
VEDLDKLFNELVAEEEARNKVQAPSPQPEGGDEDLDALFNSLYEANTEAAPAAKPATPTTSDPEDLDALFNSLYEGGSQESAPPKAPPKFIDYAESFLTGAATQILPTAVTAEQYSRDRTTGELISQVAGNLAGVMGAMAVAGKAGAAIGTVAMPGAGTIAGYSAGALGGLVAYSMYAAYQGIGEEFLRSRAVGQDFKIARAAMNVGLNINPMLRASSGTAKAIRMAGQAAVSGAVEASYGEGKVGVGVGIAAGLLGMMFVPVGKVKQTPQQLKDTVELLQDPDKGVFKNTLTRMDKEFKPLNLNIDDIKVKGGDLKEAVTALPDDFKKYVAMKNLKKDALDEAVVGRIEKLKDAKLEELWEDFNMQKVLQEEVSKSTMGAEAALLGIKDDAALPGLKLIQGPRWIAKRLDDTLDIGAEETIDAISQSEIMYRNATGGLLRKAERTIKEMDKNKINRWTVGKMLSGKEPITDKYKPYVEAFRGYYEEAGVMLEKSGFDLKRLPDYMNMSGLDPADLHNGFKKSFKKMAEVIGTDNIFGATEAHKKALSKAGLMDEYVDFMKSMKFYGGDEGAISDLGGFNKFLKNILDPDKASSTRREIGALFERTDEMPDRWREFDVGKNFAKYLNNNLKTGFMARPLQQLQDKINLIENMGMHRTADYLKKFRQHQLGYDMDSAFMSGINAAVQARRAKWREAAKYIPGADMPLPAKERVMDFLNWSTTLAYPNLLGASLSKSIRNLGQLPFLTIPHIHNPAFGTKLALKASLNLPDHLAKPAAKGKFVLLPAIQKFLQEKNIAATGEAIQGAQTQLTDVLKANSKYVRGVDRANEVLMSMYAATDDINRYMSYQMGAQWAKELTGKGRSTAMKSLVKLPTAVQSRVSMALRDNNTELAGDILGKHLVGVTQFHYGKTQMHELGRVGGRLFSMFSKWPSEIASEVIYNVQKGGLEGYSTLGKKLLAPWALIYGAQQVREQMYGDKLQKESQVSRFLLGDSLMPLAPLTSVESNLFDLSQGIALTPVKEAFKLAGKIKDGKSKDIGKDTIDALYKSFAPFSPVPMALTNEINRMLKAKDSSLEKEFKKAMK